VKRRRGLTIFTFTSEYYIVLFSHIKHIDVQSFPLHTLYIIKSINFILLHCTYKEVFPMILRLAVIELRTKVFKISIAYKHSYFVQ
jgi:hypothetical protein